MSPIRKIGDYRYQVSLNEEEQATVQKLFEQGLHGNTHAAVIHRLIDEALLATKKQSMK
jgi:hypothetical protein